MAGRSRNKKAESWGVKNGPWLIVLVAAGALIITILIWRTEPGWRFAALGFLILLTIFLLIVGQQNSCFFDVERRLIFIQERRVWKGSVREIPFDDVENVAVLTASSGDGNRNHSVYIVLKSGEMVRLTAHPSSGKLPKKIFAQKISDTLNQYRTNQFTPMLDGIVKVVRKGITNGHPWSINLITVNDSTPITQWICDDSNYQEGFLLLIPAKNTSLSAAGILSKTSLFFYKQYLKGLMIAKSHFPRIDGSHLLRNDEHLLGSSFTCISDDPKAAVQWITQKLADRINAWMENPPLDGGKSEKEPHILLNGNKIILGFRKLYHTDEQIQQIVEFGVSLIEGHKK